MSNGMAAFRESIISFASGIDAAHPPVPVFNEFALMTGELSLMFADLIKALGGEKA